MREHWKFMGAELALGIHPDVDGKRCYRFRFERMGTGATNLLIPIETFWGRK